MEAESMDKRKEAVRHLQTALQYAYESAMEAETIGDRNAISLHDQIEKSLEEGEKLADDFDVDVVYASAYSIKKYFMESGNPRQMRGASQLLNEVFMIYIPEIVRREHIPECICFNGGSQIYLILPKGAGQRMAADIERCITAYTVTAQGAAVFESVSANELIDDTRFAKIMDRIMSHLQDRRMLKYQCAALANGSRTDCVIPLEELIPEEERKHMYVSSYDGHEMRCSRCRLRQPRHIAKIEREGNFVLCRSCAHKEVVGSYVSRNSFRARCADFCKHQLEFSGTKLVIDNEIRTTDDLKDRNGDIALLYADINNLGGAGLKLNGIIDRNLFYEAIEETVQTSLFRAIIRTMKVLQGQNPIDHPDNQLLANFEIIAAGGDDVCVLLPGEGALNMAVEFVQEFEQVWKSRYINEFSALKSGLSISVGVSVARYNTPVAFMHDTTENLLGSAKAKAHKSLAENGVEQGAIDILHLNNDGQWAVDPDYLRERKSEDNPLYKENAILTMRPFSILEAKQFLQVLRIAENLPNHLLRTIDSACKSCIVEEGKLFFEYLQAKMSGSDKMSGADETPSGKDKKENLQELLIKINQMLQERIKVNPAEKSGMYFELNKKEVMVYADQGEKKEWIAPWHDIVDLCNQKGGAHGYKGDRS